MHYGTSWRAEGSSGDGILNAILGWTMGSVLLRSVHGIWTTGASYFVVYTTYGPRERLEDCIFKYHKS